MVDYSNIPRDSRRVPLETRVQFKFDRFSGFISEYSSNISPGGMFIRTHVPQPPGTILDFEFRMGDGFELIKGRGEVVWNRVADEGPPRPAGMGIRFLELSGGSKELIYRIVDQHILQGGTPFDVTQRPPDLTPAPAPAASPGPRSTPALAAVPALRPDVFELAPPPAIPRRETGPSSGAVAWQPANDEPGLGPPPAAEPFPELLRQSPPESQPAPLAPMFSTTFGSAAARPPRRILPWILLAVVLALAAGAFLLRERLPAWIGIGEEATAQAAPPVRPERTVQPGPAVPASPEAERAPSSTAGATAPTPPPVAEQASPTPAEPDAGPLLTQLEKITWSEVSGGTEVVLWGNGVIGAEVYTRTRIDGNPPRELVRFSGIRRPYPQTRVVVGTPEVLQIRVGYHPETGQGELHVVLDLAHPRVTVTAIEAGQRRLRIQLQRR